MNVRIRYCHSCRSRVEHRADTGIIIREHPAGTRDASCADCERWIAGKTPPKAKRAGES